MFTVNRLSFSLMFVSQLLLFSAASAVVSVGRPPCAVPTIQRAIDAILASQREGDFFDNDIVVAGGNYNETLTISGSGISNKDGAIMTITGGYDAGCNAPQAGSVTLINAAGRSGSVLTIHNGKLDVSLRTLTLVGASHDGNGGGINFDGAGRLGLTNVELRDNHAGYGGGLFANGRAPGLSVFLHSGTRVVGNEADRAGGGVRVQGQTRLFMLNGNTQIDHNAVSLGTSDGAGGGLQIVGPARADIGSGTISANSAEYGGGVSVNVSGGESGILRFFSTVAGEPTQITSNSASRAGGGIFVAADSGGATGSFAIGAACGYGYSISSNIASEGAAVYADTHSGFGFTVGGYVALTSAALSEGVGFYCGGAEPASERGALPCPVGRSCNFINDNRTENGSGNATGGSAVLVQTEGSFAVEHVEMRRNRGAHVIRGFEGDVGIQSLLSNCLLADNVTTSDLIRMEEDGGLQMNHCTVAGNVIGGTDVFSLTGDLTLTESLVWQPGKTILDQDDDNAHTIRNVLASEIVSLGGGNSVEAAYPQFVAPDTSNYHLLSSSPALDFAPSVNETDLDGRARTVDLAVPDRPGGGPLDLGAYELSGLPIFPPDETFDEVTIPSLPFGWINTHSGAGGDWITVGGTTDNPSNSAFTDDPDTVSDKSLETPPFEVVANGRLTFRHKVDLETGYDGAVLEIALFPGPFVDIVAAGGHFISGGYNATIIDGGGGPLGGRPAWSGAGTDFQTVVVSLPESANGRTVRLRWRVGTDSTIGLSGYWLDDIHVDVDADPFVDTIFSDGYECPPDGCA